MNYLSKLKNKLDHDDPLANLENGEFDRNLIKELVEDFVQLWEYSMEDEVLMCEDIFGEVINIPAAHIEDQAKEVIWFDIEGNEIPLIECAKEFANKNEFYHHCIEDILTIDEVKNIITEYVYQNR